LAITPARKVVAWGDNFYGQSTPPANLSGVIAIAAGLWHSLALKSDGTVVGWGDNDSGQIDIPAGLTDAVAIAASGKHSLALRSDGTVIAWGDNTDSEGLYSGQSVVPTGLAGVAEIGAGDYHSLAIALTDGSVIGWGDNSAGQIPAAGTLSNVVVAVGGSSHSLALKNNATVVAWGNNGSGQCNISPSLQNVTALAAGEAHSLVLLGTPPAYPQPLYPTHTGNEFSVVARTIAGNHYALEYKNALSDSNWTSLTAIIGNGSPQFLIDRGATGPRRLYRIKQW
jgi:alpha-tubulin suppressor-like RCC1 family protein